MGKTERACWTVWGLLGLVGLGLAGLGVSAAPASASGGVRTVALSGAPAPGAASGVTLVGFSTPALNSQGELAFTATLAVTGVTTNNRDALYNATNNGLGLIARSGDAAAGLGAGISYSGFQSPLLSDQGQIAFEASLSGQGVDFLSDNAVYQQTSGGLNLVAREADAAPGTPAGVVFQSFDDLLQNNQGDIAFRASLSGTGITQNNNQTNIVKTSRDWRLSPGKRKPLLGCRPTLSLEVKGTAESGSRY